MILDHVVGFGSEAQGRLVDHCHHELGCGLIRSVGLKPISIKKEIQWEYE